MDPQFGGKPEADITEVKIGNTTCSVCDYEPKVQTERIMVDCRFYSPQEHRRKRWYEGLEEVPKPRLSVRWRR